MHLVLCPSSGSFLIAMVMSVLCPRLTREPKISKIMGNVTYHRNFGATPPCLIFLYLGRWRQGVVQLETLSGMSNSILVSDSLKLALPMSICNAQTYSCGCVRCLCLCGSGVPQRFQLMLNDGEYALVRCGNFCCCCSQKQDR